MKTNRAKNLIKRIRHEVSSSEHFCRSATRGERAVCVAELQDFCFGKESVCDRLDTLIEGAAIVKHDAATTVAMATIAGCEVVIKRYNYRGPGYALKRLFARSRGENAFIRGMALEKLGIDTPTPLMFCTRSRALLPHSSYVVNERFPGNTLCDLFDEGRVSEEQWVSLCDGVAAILRILHDNGLTHGDVKTPNLLYDGKRLAIIDLDSLRAPALESRFERFCNKDLAAFERRVLNYPQRNGVK